MTPSSSYTNGTLTRRSWTLIVKITRGHALAKEQLNDVSKPEGIKLLGVGWDKVQDTLYVDFPSPPAKLTKRGILTNLAKMYDSLGLASPVLLEGKLLYLETCV